MRRRQSRVRAVDQTTGDRQEQPASLDREKSGWDRKMLQEYAAKQGRRQATYSIRKRHLYQALRSSSRKIAKGQDGLGTVGDMVGGRRVSRNINPLV